MLSLSKSLPLRRQQNQRQLLILNKMGLIQQNLESVTFVAGHPTAARTATGQTTGIDVKDYDGDLIFILDSAAGGGSSPTLDVTIEDSADNSSFSALSGAAFTQVTGSASAQTLEVDANGCKRYVRIKYTIGGSSPSFTFSVNGIGLKKYG
jgi:hypothetical protein